MHPSQLPLLAKSLGKVPGGKKIFLMILFRVVPYSGTLPVRLIDFEVGRVELHLLDRRSIRNHLGSIHAAALMNFSELVSGLAFTSLFAANTKGIVTNFEISYLKKARGKLIGKLDLGGTSSPKDGVHNVVVSILDQSKEKVCEAIATWQVRTGKNE